KGDGVVVNNLSMFLQELRSLAGRMKILYGTSLYSRGVDLGPAWESLPNGQLVRCTRTHARIRDRQQLYAIHPKGSLVDLHLFLVGWDMGFDAGKRKE